MEKFGEKVVEVVLAATPVAVIYFAGIIYLSVFLNSFSISMHEIDMPIPVVLSYSFNAFSNRIFLSTIAVVYIVCIILCIVFKIKLFNLVKMQKIWKSNQVRLGLAFLMVLAFFSVTYFAARDAARANSSAIWAGHASTVMFVEKPEPPGFYSTERQSFLYRICVDGRDIRFIVATGEKTYALCRLSDGEGFLIAQSHEGYGFLPIRDVAR